MKYATRMLVLALTMLPLMATAQLTGTEKIVAQVPFGFVVGSKVVPSGEWTVQHANTDARILFIRNTDAAVGMFSNISLVEAKKAPGHCTLVFHKYGNQYFLSGVNIADSPIGYRLPESRAEAETRAQNGPATEEILVASLR
jgi:hypothetical protein